MYQVTYTVENEAQLEKTAAIVRSLPPVQAAACGFCPCEHDGDA